MCHEDIHIEKIEMTHDTPRGNPNHIFPFLYLPELNQKNTEKEEQGRN